ncbi:hypothetical protein [Micromonospora sp. B006]|uniref:hypothetical protein n=1 Tax=Micromonospora sp. B006 TaxID=2201999 RepID=UPI0013763946|nr:hypothetical protein [Micromonospora sp. B006]
MDALSGDAEHGAGHGVRHRLGGGVTHPPRNRLAERAPPPVEGRLERAIPWIQGGDHSHDRSNGRSIVAAEHRGGPGAGPLVDDGAQRVDAVVAVEQDLEGVEQAYLDQPDELFDKVPMAW